MLARPGVLVAAACILLVSAYCVRPTPGNPPGLHRDEASIAYNAWTISHHLRDQNGALVPVFFVSVGDYKSPLFVYALAGLFRITGPSKTAALELGATAVLAAILLLGLLAWRRTRSIGVATATIVLGGLTPWLYELGRTFWETTMFPLALVAILLVTDWAYHATRPFLVRAPATGLALGALAYVYAGGRLLAVLYAAALLVFAGRDRWRWLLGTWAAFAVSLIPMIAYSERHPEFVTARWNDTTFVKPGMSAFAIVKEAAWNYVQDVSLWHWIVSGDPKPHIHSWGAGQLYASVVVLAAIGTVIVLRRHRHDPWWRFVIVVTLLGPVPAALTNDRHHALRLLPIPVFLLVLAAPGLELVFRHLRTQATARLVAGALTVGVALQFVWALHWFDVRGPARGVFFEADVPTLLDQAFASSNTIYIDYDDLGALSHAWWYAASHHLPPASVVRLPDGGIPPPGSTVFGRLQSCDYQCEELARVDETYWLAKAIGPNPS